MKMRRRQNERWRRFHIFYVPINIVRRIRRFVLTTTISNAIMYKIGRIDTIYTVQGSIIRRPHAYANAKSVEKCSCSEILLSQLFRIEYVLVVENTN